MLTAGLAALPLAAAKKKIPIGLELYSVREELAKDLTGTVRAVAKMGYEAVEFFSPYAAWTPAKAKEVRALLDELGIQCPSTHNSAKGFAPDQIDRTIELNTILGSKFVVMASAGRVENLDGWKKVAEVLTAASEKMKAASLMAGFHNHKTEFLPIDGTRPLEVLAKNTPRSVVLQLDVGTCLDAGVDPVAWIEKNPGRIKSVHLKDWSAAKGYKVLFGDGDGKWKKILDVAQKEGGAESFMIEQEGGDLSPMETVAACLKNYRKLRG
jgi:sugar phosphate isomerase/epimerase